MLRVLFAFPIILFLLSCSDDRGSNPGDISRLADVDMEDIFLEYRVTAEEGDDNLNIVLQFREGSEDGRTLVVGDAGSVELDGEKLTVDSTDLSGAYYEVQKPIATFTGDHTIVLAGPGDKKFEERFRFAPMVLLSGISDTVRRSGDLVLQLGGLEEEAGVRIVMTDTSFVNEGINRLDTVRQGRLVISRAELDQMADGDIHLELYREIDRAVRGGGGAGGRFTLTYALKRDFILTD